MTIYREAGGSSAPSPLKKGLGWEEESSTGQLPTELHVWYIIHLSLSQQRDKSFFHLSLTLLSIKITAKTEFLALTSFRPPANVLNLPAGVHPHVWFSSFPLLLHYRAMNALQEWSPKFKIQYLTPVKSRLWEPGKVSKAFCGSVTLLCSAQDPTQRMVSPTVGQPSHLNEQNEYNPHRQSQRLISQVVLDIVKWASFSHFPWIISKWLHHLPPSHASFTIPISNTQSKDLRDSSLGLIPYKDTVMTPS